MLIFITEIIPAESLSFFF